jgi:hypothetical protein
MWHPRTWHELAAACGVVTEAIDLDFKAQLTSNAEIAKDVAAMTVQGGVIAYGIDEDDKSVAKAITPLELRHAAERIQQVVDSAIWPRPAIEIDAIEDPAGPTMGVLLVTVTASALAPHFTRDRFPARSGTTTRYLTEHEIAALYEQRRQSLMASEDNPILSDHLDATNTPTPTRGTGELRIFVAPLTEALHPRGVYLGRPLLEAAQAAQAKMAWLSHGRHQGLLGVLGDPWTPRGTVGWQLAALPAGVLPPTATVTCAHDLSLSYFGSRLLDAGEGVAWSAHEELWTADTLAFLSFAGHFLSAIPGVSLLRIEIGLDGLHAALPQPLIASSLHP